ETVLYSFGNGTSDAAQPLGLTQASDGNFYGIALAGGAGVFKLTSGGTESLLHTFPTNSGIYPGGPNDGFVQASDGNFYGVTFYGGVDNKGTVFKMTPDGHPSIIYSFTGSPDGANPCCTLVQDASGNLYGTTYDGGANGAGTIFMITLEGTETVLHSFNFNVDGGFLLDGLTLGSDGNLYGASTIGGSTGISGTIFKITPASLFTLLYTFKGGASDGSGPHVLMQASDGNLYGTTAAGGPANFGSIFRITTGGIETPLYFFTGGSDSAGPQGGLVQGPDGALYGTAAGGSGGGGFGSIFKITLSGTFKVLYDFNGSQFGDGESPEGTLVVGPDGNLYGTTNAGGTSGDGVVFEATRSGAELVLHEFNGVDGADPGPLLLASDGRFYGLGGLGGADNDGTIFVLSAPEATLSSLSPSSATAGGSNFTLTVNGSNFDPGAVVDWNGAALTTTFVSEAELQASVPASDIATAGTASVTVVQNATTSNALTFTIDNPAPVLSIISPSKTGTGGPAFTLVVNGSAFLSSSTVDWNGSPLTTTFVSQTELTATVPASDIATPGTAAVTVVNPAPGGGASNSLTFTIAVTTVGLTGASVVKNSDGSYTATVSLTNTGFHTASSAKITKSSLGSAATKTTLPVSLGNIAPGATVTAKLKYPSSAGTSGKKVTLSVLVAFTGGSNSDKLTVTLP
ncbi:MAG TPA: choice-of-anchor tandem repeat GloVer-containing protein, partial [Chthonomonadaceae bacterium]|nr:choice-of-anchor tandem repeat GloVer-containing protein [Chthonomonadaceae bacterium]